MKIKLLDCTLRDGGHVNDFQFGKSTIIQIVEELTKARLDLIEIGFLCNCEYKSGQTKFNSISQVDLILDNIVAEKELGQKYVLMVRPDWLDISKLKKSKYIDGIRIAFYEKDTELALNFGERARNKGFDIYFNPINVLSYANENLLKVLNKINAFNPNGVSVVDTFGAMDFDDLDIILKTFETSLDPAITIGLHLHENLSSSFGLAQLFISKMSHNRNYIVDTSLNGMGRIPGNLPTELMANYIHKKKDNKLYDINLLYNIIEKQIYPIKQRNKWGYSIEYLISANYGVHRSYAEYYREKKQFSLVDIEKCIKFLFENNKGHSFSEKEAQNAIDNLCLGNIYV